MAIQAAAHPSTCREQLLCAAACLLAFVSIAELGENYFQLVLLPPESRPEDEPDRSNTAGMLLICGSNPAYSRRLCSSRLGPRIGTAGAALAVATLVVAGYLQGPVSTGGALSLREFAALNNLLAWPICVSALGLLFLESYPVGAPAARQNGPRLSRPHFSSDGGGLGSISLDGGGRALGSISSEGRGRALARVS